MNGDGVRAFTAHSQISASKQKDENNKSSSRYEELTKQCKNKNLDKRNFSYKIHTNRQTQTHTLTDAAK